MMKSCYRSLLEVIEKLEEREDPLDYLRQERLVGPLPQQNHIRRGGHGILHSTRAGRMWNIRLADFDYSQHALLQGVP